MSDQIPPADRLAQVRAMLKVFGDEENQLKLLMINDPSARTGNAHLVEIREVETTRTDLAEMRKNYGDLVAEFTFKVKTTRVELRAVDRETGEITSLRRQPKEAVA